VLVRAGAKAVSLSEVDQIQTAKRVVAVAAAITAADLAALTEVTMLLAAADLVSRVRLGHSLQIPEQLRL
jgi:hypothetical protein